MLTLVRSTAPSIPEEDEDRPIRKSVLMRADAEATYDGPIPQEVKDAIAEQQRIERETEELATLSHPEKLRYYARREWAAIRKIWRRGPMGEVLRMSLQGSIKTSDHCYRHYWSRARLMSQGHIRALAAFREAEKRHLASQWPHRRLNIVS